MADQQKPAQGSAATAKPSLPFSQRDIWQKMQHISKVIVFFATFGFAFPNILND